MTLEGLDATTAFWSLVELPRTGRAELPHLDRPVQAAADEILAARGESHTVYTILVAVRTLEPFYKMPRSDIPDADALVQRPCRHQLAIWRDGNSRDTIFDAQGQDVRLGFDIPESDSSITATRSYGAAISREV